MHPGSKLYRSSRRREKERERGKNKFVCSCTWNERFCCCVFVPFWCLAIFSIGFGCQFDASMYLLNPLTFITFSPSLMSSLNPSDAIIPCYSMENNFFIKIHLNCHHDEEAHRADNSRIFIENERWIVMNEANALNKNTNSFRVICIWQTYTTTRKTIRTKQPKKRTTNSS